MTKLAVRTRKRVQSLPSSASVTPEFSCNRLHENLRIAVTYARVDELKPPKRALRQRRDRQLNQIKASITELGFVNPILINHENQIVSGHGR
jgi:hypothetical protein